MQKQPPTLGRVLVMVGFGLSCFGLLLFLWLAFGGSIPLQPKGYRFRVSFGEATQLARQGDVRIAGVNVGKVENLQAAPNGRTLATIQLGAKYAPIPRDSRAILRQKTLLGETYVQLTPGRRSSGMLPENGQLAVGQVAPTVQLDEIFRTLDPKTRQAFRQWTQSMAASFAGRGRDLSDAFGNLGPFAEDATTLLTLLRAQGQNVRGLISDTGNVFSALTARDGQLRSLIVNSNRVFSTTARRDRDLQALFRVLPTFQREARLTTVRVARFSRTTNPLITNLHPAARQLSPTLVSLARLAPDLQALFRDLNPLIDVSRTGLPATSRFLDDLHPLLAELDGPLRELNPILRFISLYRDELRTFFANVPASTQAAQVEPNSGGVPVHYLRTLNPINPENFAVYPKRIGSNRNNAYELPHAATGLGYASVIPAPQGKGLLYSFETRQCGRSDPTQILAGVSGSPTQLPAQIIQNIANFAFGAVGGVSVAGQPVVPALVPAPPCVEQPTFRSANGQDLKFPHLTADAKGSTRGR